MSDCARLESELRSLVAGDTAGPDLDRLRAHARGCAECGRLLGLHRDLGALGASAPDPDPLAPRPWAARRVAALATAATLIFAAGLFAGRGLPARPAAGVTGTGVTGRLLEAMNTDARSNRDLTDVEDSRFTYSDVSFRRVDADRVALDFDVTTHVRLVESTRSELVRDVLVHALLSPSSVGSRLKAMSYAADTMEPKVREALIFALGRDESLAVRLQALTILSDYLNEPYVAAAVLAAVRSDEAVQLRLLALDYLAAHQVDRDRIRRVIQEEDRPGNEALLVRLAEYERQP